MSQAWSASSGMNSMKRTSYGCSRANSANGSTSSSVNPRMPTALILIGCASGNCGERLEAAQHAGERVAAGHLEEAVALQRVDRDVEAGDAGVDERGGVALEQEAVRRDREVVDERREHRGQARELAAHERLAAGQAHGAHAHRC